MILEMISGNAASIIRIFRSNIKYKLFLIFISVISVPTLLFGIISYTISSSAVETDFIRYNSQLIGKVSQSLDENFQNLTHQSTAVYTNSNDLFSLLEPKSLSNYGAYMELYNRVSLLFQGILQSNDKVDGITLLTLKGEVKCFVNRRGGFLNSLTVRDQFWVWQSKAVKGFPLLREPHYNEFVDDKAVSKLPVVSVSRTLVDINSPNNVEKGILLIDQEASRLEQFMTDVQTEKNEIIMVFGQSGNVVYSNYHLNNIINDQIAAAINTQPNNSFDFLLNGDRMLATFAESPETHWKVISLLPYTELQKRSQFLKNINITLIIFLGILSFVLSILFSNLVTNPLKKLMSSFRSVQRGDFNTKIMVKGSDELSQIGDTFNAMVTSINQLIKEKYEITLFRKEAELTALQNQINPHFLYNTLTSIKTIIDSNDNVQASMIVQSLSEIFRYNLSNGNHVVTFGEELEHIRKYLFIQKCRFMDKITVEYDIDEESLRCSILRLTLQPIVENALFHGLEPKVGKGEIRLVAKVFKDLLYIYIIDNGLGILPDKLEKLNAQLELNPESNIPSLSDRIGIHNVNSRIKYYFGPQYGLKISSDPDSFTTVRITLPFIADEE